MTLKGCTIPNFKLNSIILHVVASYKYLGHYITDDLSDDDDINRQRRTLFVQGNILLRKFNMRSFCVKLTHVRTYCSPMYRVPVEYNNSTLTKLQIAYHNIFFNVSWHVQIWNAPATYAHFLTYHVDNL